ncbi:ATP-binding protein [Bradyrhizobium sp. SSUT112]|uniref:ATP-binding protein n=1 Tax=Bradyrhizobium sp. SSUT112 TaxID=3040604 RepID=UPI002449DB87|nr:ATP-binding protein [Bradyrhizobium sp. SSUT112]MDH2353844.1 ATP-binding protein [Bradyrhizobium sp. SSUT112]
MKFDVLGRINNMRLPDGRTAILYSVYEAVSNAIHAINDRFTEQRAAEAGVVDVDIEVDKEGDIASISISDNGVGFTSKNLESFETSDSRFKYQRGGKGVGRFIWFKMFRTIKVDSVYLQGKSAERITFGFVPEKKNSIVKTRVSPAPKSPIGTKITLSDLRPEQKGRVRPSSYLKDLALHFFPQFIAGTLPRINITYRGETSSLNEFISDQVDPPVRAIVPVDFGEGATAITVDHLFVDASISTGLRNSYLLTAHGRLVGEPVSIERKYALKELKNGKAYVAVVSSEFLDERVDQERLGFKLTQEQQEILEDKILEEAERFLEAHIEKLRSRQKITVQTLLKEHPQLATQIASIDEYVAGLAPSMDDEQIAQNLFVLLYREEKELRKRIEDFDHLAALEPEVREEARSILTEISNQEKHRLAELVVKRHQVLKVANLLLKYDDDEKQAYRYERVIHELVCPMGEMYRSGDYADHNLWLIDDELATYQFFASDKPIRTLAREAKSTKEPDLVFFNPLGFRREGTADPITIVEFKRPGDERLSQDPINQVLQYIDDFRDSKVRDLDGNVISEINQNTPFNCIIVCDLTASARRLFERSIAQDPTPDGDGYYGWSKPHNAYIRVLSYRKMLRDAELRNKAYFDQLRLESPSAAAKKRSAKVRERRTSDAKAVGG